MVVARIDILCFYFFANFSVYYIIPKVSEVIEINFNRKAVVTPQLFELYIFLVDKRAIHLNQTDITTLVNVINLESLCVRLDVFWNDFEC